MSYQTKNNNLYYLTDPTFIKVNRIFTLSFENADDRISFSSYYTEIVEIKTLHSLPSSLHWYSHDIRFVNVFDSFIPVIMPSTLRLESSVSFETQTLLDKSLRVRQLPTHQSNLTANGW